MNFEDLVRTMTLDALEEAYAHNSSIDWYKCNVIRAEQRLRSEGKLIYVSARTDIVLSSNLN